MANETPDARLLNLLMAGPVRDDDDDDDDDDVGDTGDDDEDGDVEVVDEDVRRLVEDGASVHARGAGRPAIFWAARASDLARVTTLLALGARADDVSDAAVGAESALHAAVSVAATDHTAAPVLQALLAAGAPAALADGQGRLPLHLAVEWGLVRCVEVLASRTPVDARTTAGQSALELSLVQRRFPVAARLLMAGAVVDAACARHLAAAPGPFRDLAGRLTEGGPAAAPAHADFIAFLAQHLDEGPAPETPLTAALALDWLGRLAEALGADVGRGLDSNDDVDRFVDEYGDDWLSELLSSYWLDAHSDAVRGAKATLPESLGAQLPDDDDLADLLWERYRAAGMAAGDLIVA